MKYKRRNSLFVLRDGSGRILLQYKERKSKRRSGLWGFFGGEIKKNETPRAAVIREAKEGLGIRVKNLKFFRRYELLDTNKDHHEYFLFTASLKKSLDELRKKQKEGDNLEMFSFEDLDDGMFGSNEMVMIRDLFGMTEKEGLIEVEKC